MADTPKATQQYAAMGMVTAREMETATGMETVMATVTMGMAMETVMGMGRTPACHTQTAPFQLARAVSGLAALAAVPAQPQKRSR
jgi:hypothetical protein